MSNAEQQRPLIPAVFPIGGLDRRGAYQNQREQTTPDACNVRPYSTAEWRERGGSRPGLTPAFHQDLTGPVMLLKSLIVEDREGNRVWVDDFIRGPSSNWQSIENVLLFQIYDNCAYVVDPAGGATKAFTGDLSADTVVEMRILPHQGRRAGAYHLFANLNSSTPQLSSCWEAVLELKNGGAFDGVIRVDGEDVAELSGGNDGCAAAGWFSLRLIDGQFAEVYWRNTRMYTSYDFGSAQGALCFGFMVEPQDICLIDRFRVQYNSATYSRTKRPLLVASAAGSIYCEDKIGYLSKYVGSGQNEKQRIWIGSEPASGTFTIAFDGYETDPLAFDITAENLQTALQGLESIGADNVLVTDDPSLAHAWVVEFVEDLALENQSQMVIDVESLVPSEGFVQLIQNGAGDTGPTLDTTHPLQCVERNQLLYIADYGEPIERGELAVQITPWNKYYVDKLEGEFSPDITTDHSIRLYEEGQNDIQRIELTKVSEGTYRIYLHPFYEENISSPIPYDALTSEVETALESIVRIGSNNVSVTGEPGDYYEVEFIGDLAGQTMAMLRVYDNSTDGQVTVKKMVVGEKGAVTADAIKSPGVTQIGVFWPIMLPRPGVPLSYTIERSPKVFDPVNATLTIWKTHGGVGFVPVGCKIITTYRDRIVLAGDPESPNQWYMSRQGDPYDWDYSQDDAGAAVSDQLSLAGQVGEMITGLIRSTDECLIFGCTTSMWILRGDAAHGGQIDNLSYTIGLVDRAAWCHGPNNMVYFLSDDGIYRMAADCGASEPVPVSREQLPNELVDLDPEQVTVSMQYDVEHRGIHIYLTHQSESASQHWYMDLDTKGFWPVQLQNDHEPFVTTYYRGRDALESGVVLGCRDGVIRRYSVDEEHDDGGAEIESYCVLGPYLMTDGARESVLAAIRAVSGGPGIIALEVFTAESAMEAVQMVGTRSPGYSTELRPGGMNLTHRPYLRGTAATLVLRGCEGRAWSFEWASIELSPRGIQRL